ncbi:MAG: hypothetical protein ACXWC2_11315 [Ramlibacter sp.]
MVRPQRSIARFTCADDGGAVVEYALVIALVVISATLALSAGTGRLGATFVALYLRVASCLAPATTTC